MSVHERGLTKTTLPTTKDSAGIEWRRLVIASEQEDPDQEYFSTRTLSMLLSCMIALEVDQPIPIPASSDYYWAINGENFCSNTTRKSYTMDIFTRKRLKLCIHEEITRRMNVLEKIYTKFVLQKNHQKQLTHVFDKWSFKVRLQQAYDALEDTIIDERKYLLRKFLVRLYWHKVTLGWQQWKWYTNHSKQLIQRLVKMIASQYKRLAMKKWYKIQQTEQKEEQIAALAWIFTYRRAFQNLEVFGRKIHRRQLCHAWAKWLLKDRVLQHVRATSYR